MKDTIQRLMLSRALGLVLVCLAAASAQDFPDPSSFIDSLKFTDDDYRDAFTALNVESGNDQIDLFDLNILFYHGEAQFAKEKFLRMVHTTPMGVTMEELSEFMRRNPVKLAIHECTFVKSQALRRLCFVDQILTYVYLVLDHETINELFSALESRLKDRKLDLADIKELKKYDERFNDDAAKYFLMEIGRGQPTIDPTKFENYVMREDLNDDFRGCKNDPSNLSTYDSGCLIKALIHYTMYDMTEYMAALVFSTYSKSPLDTELQKSDMLDNYKTHEVSIQNVHRFFDIIDTSKDGTITYAEFRAYVFSHSVKLHLERACLQGDTVKAWHVNRLCITWALWDLTKENHRPMLMSVPDLDMLFLFEEFDKSNDGKIDANKDLVQRRWNTNMANKFVNEIDGSDNVQIRQNGYVTLNEFNYYVNEPNMVYGLGDCLIKEAGKIRLTCYVRELEEIISSVLNKNQVIIFRRFYQKTDKDPITRKELEAVGMTDKVEIDNFLNELGMGDEDITKWEFTWFVKQQELSQMLPSHAEARNNPHDLHNVLLDYLKHKMTEYDIQELFRRFDKNNNFELDREDFTNVDDANILSSMNFLDRSGRVSFLEFWLFLHTPSIQDTKSLRKRKLEKDCTSIYNVQDRQLDCYERTMKDVL